MSDASTDSVSGPEPPRVFISWSGDVSSAVATALRRLIDDVFGEGTCWISTAHILAGQRWAVVLGQALEQSSLAVVCLTIENRAAQWLLYEAGAVSHSPKHRIVPLLFGVSLDQVPEPLRQFEAATADEKVDVLNLLNSINGLSSPPPLEPGRIAGRLDECWSQFIDTLEDVPDPQRALGGLIDDRRSCYIVCPTHAVDLGVNEERVEASRALDLLDVQAVVQVTRLLDRCGRTTHPQIVDSRTELPDGGSRDFILFGGSRANNMTRDALELFEAPYWFSEDSRSLIVPGREPLTRKGGIDYGIVVKFNTDEHIYIVIAGIGGSGTLAAARRLNRLVEEKVFLNSFVACLVSTDLRTNYGLVRQLEARVRVGRSGRDWDVVSSADDWSV